MLCAPQCGDELHTRSASRLSRLQDWFVRRPGEEPTLSTHVGGFIDSQTLVHALIGKGVVREDWETLLDKMNAAGTQWCIVRQRNAFTRNEQMLYRAFLKRHLGKRYSPLELLGQAADGVLGRLLRRDVMFWRVIIDRIPQWVICSGLIVRANVHVARLPRNMLGAAPDDLWDYRMMQLGLGEAWIVAHSPDWFEPWSRVEARRAGAMAVAG